MSDLSGINASFGINSASLPNPLISSSLISSPATAVAHQILGNPSNESQSSIDPARVSHFAEDEDSFDNLFANASDSAQISHSSGTKSMVTESDAEDFDNLFANASDSAQISHSSETESVITESDAEDFNNLFAVGLNQVGNLPPDLKNAAMVFIPVSDQDKLLQGDITGLNIDTISAFKGHPITSLVAVGVMTPAGRLHLAPAFAAPFKAAAAARPAAIIKIGGRAMPLAKLAGRLGRDLTTAEFSLCNAICRSAIAQLKAKREKEKAKRAAELEQEEDARKAERNDAALSQSPQGGNAHALQTLDYQRALASVRNAINYLNQQHKQWQIRFVNQQKAANEKATEAKFQASLDRNDRIRDHARETATQQGERLQEEILKAHINNRP